MRSNSVLWCIVDNSVFFIFFRYCAAVLHTNFPHHSTESGILRKLIRPNRRYLHILKCKVQHSSHRLSAESPSPEFLSEHIGKRAGAIVLFESQKINAAGKVKKCLRVRSAKPVQPQPIRFQFRKICKSSKFTTFS